MKNAIRITVMIAVFILLIALTRVAIHGDTAFGVSPAAGGWAHGITPITEEHDPVTTAQYRTWAHAVDAYGDAISQGVESMVGCTERICKAQHVGYVLRLTMNEYIAELDRTVPECAGEVDLVYANYLSSTSLLYAGAYYNLTGGLESGVPRPNDTYEPAIVEMEPLIAIQQAAFDNFFPLFTTAERNCNA